MSNASRKKLLLMGHSGSGKSSMRSIIFSNYSAFDTRRLGATMDVELSHLRFLGNLSLTLWDCGGQDVFMENYFSSQKDHIFKMVQVLIHVFDVESKLINKDIEIFVKSLTNLQKYSPDAKVFVLLHKMDLVQIDKRQELFAIMMDKLQKISNPYQFKLTGFPTSIWDESLYKAWSQIVCSLIPNINLFNSNLIKFNEILDAEEIILFEKTTFLVISSTASIKQQEQLQLQLNQQQLNQGDRKTVGDSSRQSLLRETSTQNDVANEELDPKRFEKISNIIKTYKQSISKLRTNFTNLIIRGSNGTTFYLDILTENMFIMIVLKNQNEVSANGIKTNQNEELLVLDNIKAARKWFEKIENSK
ncbi:GTP-binding protein GTR1 [Lodderomyces elongisporus NRRL YB-4239]|uniref:GTP-binding protein n=1 Tax=Lodderomyces elongisporus (strain ATCC 11503 / CBS 2605 / JCM 1781 / NBRC 1676 / NRRL YB-4239) TaxID=379508 RepID=A5DYJ0_LODEL|nr:GTP-binding protein GTR1 [Lodderomyces elongisporus NRRL YB-4239]